MFMTGVLCTVCGAQVYLCRLQSIATHRDHFVVWHYLHFVKYKCSRFEVLLFLVVTCHAGDTCIPWNAAILKPNSLVTYSENGNRNQPPKHACNLPCRDLLLYQALVLSMKLILPCIQQTDGVIPVKTPNVIAGIWKQPCDCDMRKILNIKELLYQTTSACLPWSWSKMSRSYFTWYFVTLLDNTVGLGYFEDLRCFNIISVIWMQEPLIPKPRA